MVELIAYAGTAGRERRVYRLSRHGIFVGEFRVPEELATHVDLATLTEDASGP